MTTKALYQQRDKPRFTKAQAVMIALASSAGFLGWTTHITTSAVRETQTLGDLLLNTRIKAASGTTTWGELLDTDSNLLVAVKCSFVPKCAEWYNAKFNERWDSTNNFAIFMALFGAMVIGWRSVPQKVNLKDPGQGRWAGLTDKPIPELLTDDGDNNKRLLYLGHLIPWERGEFRYDQMKLAMLRRRDRCENLLVMGAPGSGKTRTWFRLNVALDAHLGNTAIVTDLKFPQTDSGFYDMVAYWKRLGRRVMVFTPFSPNSMRLPLLAGINNLDEALKLARAIIAPPEYKDEVGKYYKDNERRALAAMILAVAQGPVPSMRELQRLGQMTVDELTQWYRRQPDPEIKAALKAMFDLRADQIRGTLDGVVNTLQVFYNANVSRATTSQPGEDIDLEAAFREPTLVYIGIEQKYLADGTGEILLQLIKRTIDRAILNVADSSPKGELPVHTTYYLDELPALGKLPYLMTNLSTLRSRNVSLMLGVQNSEQGSLVYGRDYYKALSQNNIGTMVIFPRGLSPAEAEDLSKNLGEMTVEARSLQESGQKMFSTPWSPTSRKGEATKLEKRPMLSPEEIRRFPRNYAVAFVKGQNPLLMAMPSLEQEKLVLTTPEEDTVTVTNRLYPFWRDVMGGVTDSGEEATKIIQSLTVKSADPSRPQPVRGAKEYFQDWVMNLLAGGADARAMRNDDKLKVMLKIDTLPPLCRSERDQLYFIGEGWLRLADNEQELTIQQEGLAVLGKPLEKALANFVHTGKAIRWAREHASEVEGFEVHGKEKEPAPKDVRGVYMPETLLLPAVIVRTLYGVVPDLPIRKRDGKEYVELPLANQAKLEAALQAAWDKQAAQAAEPREVNTAGTVRTAMERKEEEQNPHAKKPGKKKQKGKDASVPDNAAAPDTQEQANPLVTPAVQEGAKSREPETPDRDAERAPTVAESEVAAAQTTPPVSEQRATEETSPRARTVTPNDAPSRSGWVKHPDGRPPRRDGADDEAGAKRGRGRPKGSVKRPDDSVTDPDRDEPAAAATNETPPPPAATDTPSLDATERFLKQIGGTE